MDTTATWAVRASPLQPAVMRRLLEGPLAALLVGLSKGGLGGGLGPLVTILVALVGSPSQAIGILLPILMAADVVARVAHRGHWDGDVIRALLSGAVVGVVLASIFLGTVDDRGVILFLLTVGPSSC